MPGELTRREVILGAAAMGATALLRAEAQGQAAQARHGWPLALNTSTIRPASLEEKLRVAAEAGYDAVELWINELENYAKSGKELSDLRKRIADLGLFVPNIIGLWNCMPAADEQRPAALETARQRLDIAAQVGARCIAAIPTPDRPGMDLLWAAQRYRELLALGREFGVRVAIEFVGFFKGISRLGQAVAIGIETNERDACMVADTFHLFRGGSGFNGIRHLNGDFTAVFHWNDAPAAPPRDQQRDADRVYPGDGVLPLAQLLRDLKAIGYRGPLSLELFNRDYWQQEPLAVARTGIAKMRRVIAESEM